MASFSKGTGYRTPFGKNEFLRSTVGLKHESYTYSADEHPDVTVDGAATKVLQPGTVVAQITSGANTGKFGPFQAGALDGRQTAANIVGLAQTFLPWQLTERDVEIGVLYGCTAVQANCIEYDAAGAPIPLSDTTATALVAQKGMSITFAPHA